MFYSNVIITSKEKSRKGDNCNFFTSGLIVVDVDSLELEVRISMVSTSGVNSMLIRDNLPELKHRKNIVMDYYY